MNSGIAVVFTLFYFVIVLGISVYVLVLLARFVRAHQRGADALETIARRLPIAPTVRPDPRQ